MTGACLLCLGTPSPTTSMAKTLQRQGVICLAQEPDRAGSISSLLCFGLFLFHALPTGAVPVVRAGSSVLRRPREQHLGASMAGPSRTHALPSIPLKEEVTFLHSESLEGACISLLVF